MRLIDADVFEKQMYNEVFEKDSEYQNGILDVGFATSYLKRY